MLWDGNPAGDAVGFARMSKQEPEFRHPPLWIHASEEWLITRREAKRRAVLAILDRVPETPAPKPPSAPKPAARRSRS